jgi:hypothetical protein
VPTVTVGLALDGDRAVALQAQSFFTLRGTPEQATLVLRDGRFVRAPVVDLVHALIDVRLDPARLLAILTGCLTPRPDFVESMRRGEWLVVTASGAIAYLALTDESGWVLRAGTFDSLQVDYQRRGPRWPREIQITSRPGTAGPAVSIAISDLAISETNAPIPPELTQPVVPAGATEISLDDLRRLLGGDGSE